MLTKLQSAIGFLRLFALQISALVALLWIPSHLPAQTVFTYVDTQIDATNYVLSGTNSFTIASGSATQSGVLSGSGSFETGGAGTLVVTGLNTYTGGTTISSGTLVVGNSRAFGAAGNSVVINGGTVSTGGFTLDYLFSGTGGTIVATGNSNFGRLTSPAGFNYLGTLNIGSFSVTLQASGTVTVGSVIMASGGVLQSNFGIVLSSGGTLTASGAAMVNQAFFNSGRTPAGVVNPASVQGPASGSLTFTGVFSGSGDQRGNISITNTNIPSNGAGGQVRIFGTTVLGPLSTTIMNIGGATAPVFGGTVGQYDQYLLQSGGALTLAGTLQLTLNAISIDGSNVASLAGGTFAPVAGNSFTLFNKTVGTLAGSFTTVDTSQATLSSNLLTWDTSKLATNGVVSVVATNYYWTGSTSATWASSVTVSTLTNFAITNTTSGAAPTANLQSFSNVFMSVPGSIRPSTASLGANLTINSLNFTLTTSTGITGSTPIVGMTLVGPATLGVPKTLTLSAGNNFQDQDGNNYAAGTGLVVQAGAATNTLTTSITVALARSQTWHIDNDAANPFTVAGIISGGSFSLTKTGVGTLVITSASNSYTGGTTVSAGILKVTGTGKLGNAAGSGGLTVNGGTVDTTTTSQNVASITLSSGTIKGTTGTITVSSIGGIFATGVDSSTLSARLAGAVPLTKSGTSLLSVLVAQLYTGTTSIIGGNMQFSGSGAFAADSSIVNVNTAGTLSGTGNIRGAVTVDAGGTVSPGVGNLAGSLQLGSAVFATGSSLALNLNSDGTGSAGTDFSQLKLTGNLDATGAFSLKLNGANGALLGTADNYTWTNVIMAGSLVGSFVSNLTNLSIDSTAFGIGTFALVQNGNNFDLTYASVNAIPEPATVALLVGLAGLGFAALRRRRKAGTAVQVDKE